MADVVIFSIYITFAISWNVTVHLKKKKIMFIKCDFSAIDYRVIQLSACFSEGIMVWEVVTPAVLSSDPKHQNVRNSEPQREHTGNHRAVDHRVHLHLYCMVIE